MTQLTKYDCFEAAPTQYLQKLIRKEMKKNTVDLVFIEKIQHVINIRALKAAVGFEGIVQKGTPNPAGRYTFRKSFDEEGLIYHFKILTPNGEELLQLMSDDVAANLVNHLNRLEN